MLENCTKEAFSEQIGKTFSISLGPDKQLVLEVVEVTRLDAPEPRPFSVMLRAPNDGYLQQGTYELENDSLGKNSLFMVPRGPDAAGEHMLYEITFG